MAGEYGIAAGINQGLQMATQGMLQADQIKQNRVKAQMEAQKFQMDMQTAGLTNQYREQQMQQLAMQMEQMKKENDRKDIWEAFSGFEATGDASILNTMRNNPNVKSLMDKLGVTSFVNIEDLSEAKKAQLGITEELLNDKSKRIVVMNTTNGTQIARNIMGVYATTGYLPKLGEKKLNDIALQQAERTESIAQKDYNDMEAWLKANPTKTYQDWLNKPKMDQLAYTRQTTLAQERIKGQYDVLKEQVKSSTKTPKEQAAAKEGNINSLINSDIDKWTSTIKNVKKNDVIDLNGEKVSVYEAAKVYEDGQKQQLDTTYKSELRGKRAVIQGAQRVLDKLDSIEDWNVGTKVQSEVERVTGDFFKSLSNDVSSNAQNGQMARNKLKEISKDLPEQERIYMESYVFPVIADYIKAMSGAAVSEQERTAYVSNMTSGWMASKSAFEASITGFKDSVSDGFNSMLDSIAPSYPKTYLDMRLADPEVKQPTNTPSNPSGPKEGDIKEWQGKTYKLVGNMWVEQGAK